MSDLVRDTIVISVDGVLTEDGVAVSLIELCFKKDGTVEVTGERLVRIAFVDEDRNDDCIPSDAVPPRTGKRLQRHGQHVEHAIRRGDLERSGRQDPQWKSLTRNHVRGAK